MVNQTQSGIDMETMFQGNLMPANYYNKNRNTSVIQERFANIEKFRKSVISQRSGLSNSMVMGLQSPTKLSSRKLFDADPSPSPGSKQYASLKEFLDEMFTEQFVQFTQNVKRFNSQSHASDDVIMMDRFYQNEAFIRSGRPDDALRFPRGFRERYPVHLKEVFELYESSVWKRELMGFMDGIVYSEKIINLYFKILEKMNLV
jgi:hypothetical protein